MTKTVLQFIRSCTAQRALTLSVLLLSICLFTHTAMAQSLGYEGPTGVFVTPLALTAASPEKGIGMPSVSYHFLAGGPLVGDFSTVSITEGFGKRFEAGFTGETNIIGNKALSPVWNEGFAIVHGKANITPKALSKVGVFSVGAIVRTGDNIGKNVDNLAAALLKGAGITPVAGQQKTMNADIYLVGTKIIPLKPVPLLLSAGIRGTNSSLWGLGGNAPGFQGRAFGAAGLVFTGPGKSTIIVASEIAQQPRHIYSATATATVLANGGSKQDAYLFDVPTSEVYAVRIVPFAKIKMNLDAGVLHAGGNIDNKLVNELAGGHVNLDMKARVAFALSYGF